MTSPAAVLPPTARESPPPPANGTLREIAGQLRIFYDGYWVRYYDVPNSRVYTKILIDSLTRRVFHHAEYGINTPGDRLEEMRGAFEAEQDPAKKRVLAAMLAGACLNRGSDILTRIVELEQIGVAVEPDNELLRECGTCFMWALEYGRMIRPLTGHEGLDELWGEPFKAFSMSVHRFLETRYIKLSLAMRAIDSIRDQITGMYAGVGFFAPFMPLIEELADSAKSASETMRSDAEYVQVWPRFVAAADRLLAAEPRVPERADRRQYTLARSGLALIREGGRLIIDLANLRVPMPKTTRDYLERCERFRERFVGPIAASARATGEPVQETGRQTP
ncbi:MAG: hypothetical protein HYR49_10135 [Gammaproteobacteria bacterium]|nr:hypothetical protein [Gammaproteobacteria bacterium]